MYILFPSIKSLILSFAGLIVDRSKSYKAFFYVAGTPLLVGFFVMFILRCFKDFKAYKVGIHDVNNEFNNESNTIKLCKGEEDADKQLSVLLQYESNV